MLVFVLFLTGIVYLEDATCSKTSRVIRLFGLHQRPARARIGAVIIPRRRGGEYILSYRSAEGYVLFRFFA